MIVNVAALAQLSALYAKTTVQGKVMKDKSLLLVIRTENFGRFAGKFSVAYNN